MSEIDLDSFACPKPPRVRLRRLRHHSQLRELIAEHRLSMKDFVLPLFIKEGERIKSPIISMPGHYQLGVDHLVDEIKLIEDAQIPAVILFGIPNDKDSVGSHALRSDSVIARAIQAIKSCSPNLLVIVDLCLCEYTDHGHCGVISPERNKIDNDSTLLLLAKQAVVLAQAGADVIAPSGMMDGMVSAIREALDRASFTEVPILSYAVKYASSFYGPFREAAEGAPQFGDRRSYQMNPANSDEAVREVAFVRRRTETLEDGVDLSHARSPSARPVATGKVPQRSVADHAWPVKSSEPASTNGRADRLRSPEVALGGRRHAATRPSGTRTETRGRPLRIAGCLLALVAVTMDASSPIAQSVERAAVNR